MITDWVLFNYGLYPVGLSGLEPPTSRLSGVRSNQLSYKPMSKSAQQILNHQTMEIAWFIIVFYAMISL